MAQNPYLYRSRTPGPRNAALDERGYPRAESTLRNHYQSRDYTSSRPQGYNMLENRTPSPQVHGSIEEQFRRLSMRPSPYDSNVAGTRVEDFRSRGYGDHVQHNTQRHGILDQGTGYSREILRSPVHDGHRGRRHEQQHVSYDGDRRLRTRSTGPLQREDRPPREGPTPRGQRPDFIIVGLFVLRISRQLIDKLNSYSQRDADAAWIDGFLSHYSATDDLAKLQGSSMDNFAKTWPVIINHFIKQPNFPLAFMQLNPIPRVHESQQLSDSMLNLVLILL